MVYPLNFVYSYHPTVCITLTHTVPVLMITTPTSRLYAADTSLCFDDIPPV